MEKLKLIIALTVLSVTSLHISAHEFLIPATPIGCSDNGYEVHNASEFTADVKATIDGNIETFYHSEWQTKRIINADAPVILTYSFDGKQPIVNFMYVPRQDGGINGVFTEFDVLIQTAQDQEPHLWKHFSWAFSGTQARTVCIPKNLQVVKKIEFHVSDGYGGHVSCAEMKFNTRRKINGVFADNLCTKLVDKVKKKDIAALPSPALRTLADSLAAGKYNLDYRLGSYECYESPASLAKAWMSPKTIYDMQPGVTGINICKGTHLVAADNIPEGSDVQLRLISFYNGKKADDYGSIDKTLRDNSYDAKISTFPIVNGVNTIEYTADYPALAYVCYFTDTLGVEKPSIKVHFINGQVNGYITPETSKAKARQMLSTSPNGHMDLVGKKVHSVCTSQGLMNYCKDYDGNPDGYSCCISLLDSLVDWEHEVLGYKKYGLVPHNRTFAYVNYKYFLFRGSLGISFIQSVEQEIFDCKRLKHTDHGMIWGMSHEWGHLHQVHPYFCWAGLSEVSNNINSIYNVLKIGHKPSQVLHIAEMLEDKTCFTDDSWKGIVSANRSMAYNIASTMSDSPELQKLCLSMSDSLIKNTQGPRGLSLYDLCQNEDIGTYPLPEFSQLYVFATICSYFTNKKGYTDFWPDLMKSIRETELCDDKYSMIAAYQNGKIDSLGIIKAKFPASYWTREKDVVKKGQDNAVPYILNFIYKASLTCGYNLMPFFEKYGYLRQVALSFFEYGNRKMYLMTKGMYDEFKADMDELVKSGRIKPMSGSMFEEMESFIKQTE